MDAVLLARLQFAATIGFHFIFAPLTIGLSWLIFVMMTRYRKTGDAQYAKLVQFWTRIFGLSFAVGVATGISMEFQFGTNWAQYSRVVGDIFGAPLAAETIFTFFLESVFVGALLFGWNRLSRNGLWFSSFMVAVGATMSAFWILVANSWMQTPAGYVMEGGRTRLTDFGAAVFNPSTVPRVLHTVDSALVTGAFFMLGISAWYLLKNRHVEMARQTLTLSLVMAFITSLGTLVLGHYHAVQVTYTQPEKLAAIEGLFTTQANAPLLIFGVPDAKRKTVNYAVRVPGMLSFLTTGRTDAVVTGLDKYPEDKWPPILLTFVPFHLMFIIGMGLIGFTTLGMLLHWAKRLYTSRWYLWLAILAIPFPFIANELGWTTAEVGRQPWLVYHVMTTSEGISASVPASHVFSSLLIFTVVYTVLFAAWLTFVLRAVHQGPEELTISPPEGKR
ncbi:MAG: cytochrome ubiquinol oxidase subunit I [Armatimonadota bacterium]